jgi:hypothetical protein
MADDLARNAGADNDALVALVTATAQQGSAALRLLWDELVSTYGTDAASRAWQEGLASSDIGQT